MPSLNAELVGELRTIANFDAVHSRLILTTLESNLQLNFVRLSSKGFKGKDLFIKKPIMLKIIQMCYGNYVPDYIT